MVPASITTHPPSALLIRHINLTSSFTIWQIALGNVCRNLLVHTHSMSFTINFVAKDVWKKEATASCSVALRISDTLVKPEGSPFLLWELCNQTMNPSLPSLETSETQLTSYRWAATPGIWHLSSPRLMVALSCTFLYVWKPHCLSPRLWDCHWNTLVSRWRSSGSALMPFFTHDVLKN